MTFYRILSTRFMHVGKHFPLLDLLNKKKKKSCEIYMAFSTGVTNSFAPKWVVAGQSHVDVAGRCSTPVY